MGIKKRVYFRMMLQKVKPTNASRRQLIKLNNKGLNLSKKPLLKNSIVGKKNSSGRNHSGKITVFHKGGGVKKKYRKVSFDRRHSSTAVVCTIEHDPNRTPIHNVSPTLSSSGQISRSAGTFSIIKEKTEQYSVIELSSGEQRYLSSKCFASIGEISKELYFLTRFGKAGQSRWCNKRPTVRGVAMNPVDHPHGGGEGKKSGRTLTPWGKPNQKGKTGRSKNKFVIKKKI